MRCGGSSRRWGWRPSHRRGGPPPPPDPARSRPLPAPPSASVRGPGGTGSGPHLTDLPSPCRPLRRALHSAHRDDATPGRVAGQERPFSLPRFSAPRLSAPATRQPRPGCVAFRRPGRPQSAGCQRWNVGNANHLSCSTPLRLVTPARPATRRGATWRLIPRCPNGRGVGPGNWGIGASSSCRWSGRGTPLGAIRVNRSVPGPALVKHRPADAPSRHRATRPRHRV
jgi:hypothetical protein